MAAEAQRAPVVRERISFAAAWRRFIIAAEPWYNWGSVHVERMQELRLSDGGLVESGGEGPVRFAVIQWLGLHLEVQVGRTPKRARQARRRTAPRFPAPAGSLAASCGERA